MSRQHKSVRPVSHAQRCESLEERVVFNTGNDLVSTGVLISASDSLPNPTAQSKNILRRLGGIFGLLGGTLGIAESTGALSIPIIIPGALMIGGVILIYLSGGFTRRLPGK